MFDALMHCDRFYAATNHALVISLTVSGPLVVIGLQYDERIDLNQAAYQRLALLMPSFIDEKLVMEIRPHYV